MSETVIEAHDGGLVLVGTEGQVAWAADIRRRVLALLDAAQQSYQEWGDDQVAALPERVRSAMRPRVERLVDAKVQALAQARAWALGHAQATWWINVADKAISAADLLARHAQQQQQQQQQQQKGTPS